MPESRSIQVMPEELTLKIAAGEVIERPSSVVKELLDNAIDAGARNVDIDIRDAGLRLIRVVDDGQGIPGAELPLAFASHATSKIRSLEDLEHLATMGFRGEALASIAAVSRMEVHTRAANEEIGSRFVIEYGRALTHQPQSAPRGMRISVSDLFSNVPARRKFVRSFRAESGNIQQIVMQYALAQPSLRITLAFDDRQTFHSPGTGRLTDAFAAVFGSEVLSSTLALDALEGGVRVEGVISTPSLTRQNRSGISVFVNGRPVQNRSLAFALEEAYSGFLMTGRHPVAAVHLALLPGEVDVNMHPSKSEVRFAQERAVHGVLHRAVANALQNMRIEARTISPDSSIEIPAVIAAENGTLLHDANGSSGSTELIPRLPVLRVFGQANQTFIIAEGPDGLYMIDQHAAHERVLFDLLDQQVDSADTHSQQLLEPSLLELTPNQMTALEMNRELLLHIGYSLEPFGHASCLVRAIPLVARGGDFSALVSEVLDELAAAPEPSAARERALAMTACKAAVKAGQSLDVQEMRELIAQLERTPRGSTCPHGRPTMIHLSNTQLEREFGR